MITFEHVYKALAGREVLKDVDFTINQGDTFVVIGPSGAGKSVTLKHIIALLRPDAGRVIVDGEVISEATGRELERMRTKFGVLFQSSALLEWLTIGENVALPLREKTKMAEDEIMQAVRDRLALVGLEKDLEKHPSELSGGMRKRAGLARALIENPDIVLYDEPTSGLDPVTSRSIDDLINSMRDKLGVTSVVVTHDLHSALAVGNYIGMIYGGRMIEIASPADFISSDCEEVQSFLESQFITKKGPWEKYT